MQTSDKCAATVLQFNCELHHSCWDFYFTVMKFILQYFWGVLQLKFNVWKKGINKQRAFSLLPPRHQMM